MAGACSGCTDWLLAPLSGGLSDFMSVRSVCLHACVTCLACCLRGPFIRALYGLPCDVWCRVGIICSLYLLSSLREPRCLCDVYGVWIPVMQSYGFSGLVRAVSAV